MENHPTGKGRTRTIGLIALAMLVALVAAVSSSSAETTTSSTAPAAAATQSAPARDTTPDSPPADPGRHHGPCPHKGAQSGSSDAPTTTTPTPEL